MEKAKEWLEQSGVDPASIELSILCSNEGKRRMAEVIQANLSQVETSVAFFSSSSNQWVVTALLSV